MAISRAQMRQQIDKPGVKRNGKKTNRSRKVPSIKKANGRRRNEGTGKRR